jgi:HK97 family phage portal protein
MIKQLVNRFLDWAGSNGFAYTGGSNPRFSLAGTRTTAGPLINEDTALSIPAFFHAMRLFGQTIGSLCWNLDQLQERGKTVARTHPVHRLLHDEPNEFQLPAAFRETIILHAISYGNGYAYIQRNGNFRPTALLPLFPDRTFPVRENGDLCYYTYVNGLRKKLEPYEVFHLPGISTNGLTGIPLVKIMSGSLGLTKAEEEFAASFFGNGCNFGGFLKSPNKLTDEARKNLKESMVASHGGLGNAFRVGLLEAGLTFEQNGVEPEQAQLVESRQFQLGDLARIVGLSPHLLYDLSRATFSNIEQLGIEAVTYSFKPWANKLCQEANRKLLYESEKGIYEARLDLKPLMAGDSKTQAERDQIRFNCLAITPNEMREDDGRNPIEGGDQIFMNQAYLPLAIAIAKAMAATAPAPTVGEPAPALPDQSEQLGKVLPNEGIDADPTPTDEEPPPAGDAKYDDGPKVSGDMVENANTIATPDNPSIGQSARALTPVAKDVAGRLLRREAKAVQNALGRFQGDDPALRRWLDGHSRETRQIATEALQSVCDALTAINGTTRQLDAMAGAFVGATVADVEKLLSSDPAQRGDDTALMLEGWKTQRIEQLTEQLIEGT